MTASKTNLIKQFIPARPFDLGEVFQQIHAMAYVNHSILVTW
jgi:hypothetical protein